MADYSVSVDHDHSGLIDVESEVTHHVDPITTDNKSAVTIEVPSPVETVSSITSDARLHSSVDLRPVVSDACVRLELAPLPPTEICQPYTNRLAFTVFGVELFAWESSGQAQTLVAGQQRRVKLPGAKGGGSIHVKFDK